MRKLSIALIIAIAIMLAMPMAVLAAPQLPHLFYGTVHLKYTSGGAYLDAPVGTIIIAKVGTVEKGRITVTDAGSYGDHPDMHLIVWDNYGTAIPAGATIRFYVNGYQASQTYIFASGSVTELNLSFLQYTPGGGGGGGGTAEPTATAEPTSTGTPRPTSTAGPTATAEPGATSTATATPAPTATATPRPTSTTTPTGAQTLVVNFWDKANGGSGPMNTAGTVLAEVTANSAAGTVSVDIEDGTKVVDAAGAAVNAINVNVATTTPLLPEGYTLVKAFEFSPSGTLFTPAIEITIKYDTSLIPAGETPVIAFYNTATGTWETITAATVNSAAGTITFSISHFTTFAVMVQGEIPTEQGGEEGLATWIWIVIAIIVLLLLALIIGLAMQRRRA